MPACRVVPLVVKGTLQRRFPGGPRRAFLPSMPKGNSFCSPLGRWEVKARAAQGSSHSPGIEMKAGLLESELENSSGSA